MSSLPTRKLQQSSEQLAAVLELIRCITHTYATAETLHRRLEDEGYQRTLRSVQRQLATLAEFLPIEVHKRGKPYQYRWHENAKAWRLPVLNAHESLLLLLAQQHLEPLLPRQTMGSLSPYFRQANDNLKGPVTSNEQQAWLKKIRRIDTSQPLLAPEIPPGVLEAVSDALYRNRWLKITYCNASQQKNDYEVMPLGLVQQGPRLYLACRYRGYDNERSLALHRILKAEVSGLNFDPPTEFDLDRYISHGRFSHGNGELVRLRFSITRESGQHLLESKLSEDQEVEELSDGYRITATVVDSILLKRWLLGFGEEVWEVDFLGKN